MRPFTLATGARDARLADASVAPGGAELGRTAARVSHRERDRRPSGHTGKADDRWCQPRCGEDGARCVATDLTRSGTELDDDVRELHDALETVLGDEDGRALVVDEARRDASTSSAETGSSDDVGSSSTRVRGAAVDAAERDALALTARQRGDGPMAQCVQVQGVKHVFDPPSHRRRVHGEVLHGIGELVFDRVGDEGRIRVLADVADGVGQVAGTVLLGAAPVDGNSPVEPAAGKMGDEAVDATQHVDFPNRSRL